MSCDRDELQQSHPVIRVFHVTIVMAPSAEFQTDSEKGRPKAVASNRSSTTGPGRRPATSRDHISTVALELFVENGFDDTSVDDIAEACGIARRTLFRYFPSKNAIPWGDFDEQLARMRARLADTSPGSAMSATLTAALLDFNSFPTEEAANHRRRMELILRVPALQAHSAIMYAGWRDVIADFAAARLRVPSDSHVPRAIGYLLLGVALAAYESWLGDTDRDLADLLTEGMAMVAHGIDG